MQEILTKINAIHNLKNITNIFTEPIKKIGYDFDGVLHTSIGELDEKDGQRHPIENVRSIADKLKPFTKIIEQIKKQLLTEDIYIITGRKPHEKDVIKQFLNIIGLEISDDHLYLTGGGKKKPILLKLRIEEFYDDSCMIIIELFNAIKNNELPDLKKIYFVQPEKLDWVEINSDTLLNEHCGKWVTSNNKQAGLYLISDNLKNPHRILIADPTENNKNLISNILDEIDGLQNHDNKTWTPSSKGITQNGDKYDIVSTTLTNLTNFLNKKIDGVHLNNFKIISGKLTDPENLQKTTWSLTMTNSSGHSMNIKKITLYDIPHPLQPNTSSLIILSYNIFWEGMIEKMPTGKKRPPLCEKNVCADNIAEVINTASKKYDFITLQEAANIEYLEKKCSILREMGSYVGIIKPEDIATYYDKNKYTIMFQSTTNSILDTTCCERKLKEKKNNNGIITCTFEYINKPNNKSDRDIRPMQILIFREGIILINVHCSHYRMRLENDAKIKKAKYDGNYDEWAKDPDTFWKNIKSQKLDENIKKIIDNDVLLQLTDSINLALTQVLLEYDKNNPDIIKTIFKTYRIIMAGDFNEDIKKLPQPIVITFEGITRLLHLNYEQNLKTCCTHPVDFTGNLWQEADNILDSKAAPITLRIPVLTNTALINPTLINPALINPALINPASDHAPVYAELESM